MTILNGWPPTRRPVVLSATYHDGAVHRRIIDPDAVPPALVAEAMLLLGLAFTEEGAAEDPRKPEDERGGHVFDSVLALLRTVGYPADA